MTLRLKIERTALFLFVGGISYGLLELLWRGRTHWTMLLLGGVCFLCIGTIRRKGFYERCSFTANPYPHVHPAYHKGVHGHDLLLMSRPDGLTDKQCRAYQAYLADVVMRNAY